jgi:hypothetical protein
MAVPTLDAPLAEWSTNFNTRGVAAPADFSLTAAQMTQYTALHTAYISAYNESKAQGSRSKALVVAKDDAKRDLLSYARELYGFIQSSLSVTNENKTLIGVTVRDNVPSPVPAPALAPILLVATVIGRIVRYHVRDAQNQSGRARPVNARGVLILTYVGENPPASTSGGWTIQGETGKTTAVVEYPDTVAPGEKCWATAMWVGTRGEFSPACTPLATYLQVGPAAEAA